MLRIITEVFARYLPEIFLLYRSLDLVVFPDKVKNLKRQERHVYASFNTIFLQQIIYLLYQLPLRVVEGTFHDVFTGHNQLILRQLILIFLITKIIKFTSKNIFRKVSVKLFLIFFLRRISKLGHIIRLTIF